MPDFRASAVKFIKKLIPFSQWLVVLLAILLPFLIIKLFPDFFHTSDVDDFRDWSQAWDLGWHSVYVNCERCNYPFLGTLLSAGLMSWINIEDFTHLGSRFRYFLAIVDALNILAIWFILLKVQVKNAPLWAGIIGLLPSSWFGSSIWGQIDGMGQFLILAFFILLIWFNASERPKSQYYLFVSLATLLLSFMLLTKQLIYFSVVALGLILLANMILYSRKMVRLAISILVASLIFATPILSIDANLILKEPYISHLQYILATGSSHGDKISYVGMNIWVFFAKDLLGSSRLALPIQLGSKTLVSIIPYSAGIFLFLVVNSFLFFIFAKCIWAQYSREMTRFDLNAILLLFVYLALVNLSFNLTLTGVHERYLYHFYPFIIIACLGWVGGSAYFNRVMLAVLLGGSLMYGVFLYAYMIRLVRPTSLSILQGLSAFHLCLFIYLLYSTLKQLNTQASSLPQKL